MSNKDLARVAANDDSIFSLFFRSALVSQPVITVLAFAIRPPPLFGGFPVRSRLVKNKQMFDEEGQKNSDEFVRLILAG